MKITFLGTGSSQGIPVIACPCPVCHSSNVQDRRLRSAIQLTEHGKHILIDSGPDLRQQILSMGVNRIDALLLTHGHRDHIGGLDELRSFVYKYKKTIPIYASDYVITHLQQAYAYLFARKAYQKAPNFSLHSIENRPFVVEGLTVIPIRVYHDTLPIWGFRIGQLTYITDAKYITEAEVDKIRGTTVLIVNALQRNPHPAHFSLQEAITLAQQVNAPLTYLTHIGHHLGYHQEVSRGLPSNIHLAYDGLQISV
ncbi:MAG: MBL fold metallo-hydrolase [Bacteroidota bacterium]